MSNAQATEKKLLAEMTVEMIAEKKQELEEIMTAQHRTRDQKVFLRWHLELADSLYGTGQELDIALRWYWLTYFIRDLMERWDDGPDLYFDRSSLAMEDDEEFLTELREIQAII